MNATTAILFALATALAASAAIAAEGDFVARGNEPGWIVRMDANGLSFESMGGEPLTLSPLPAPETVETYRSTVDGKPFTLNVSNQLCVDTMSGMPHPDSVIIEIGDQRLEGCGGEPATLLHGEWTVVGIDENPLVAGSNVTLAFAESGEVNGAASCNSYFGSFTLTAEGLTIDNTGATMMACEEPLMDQEALYLAILTAVTRFDIGPDGSLVLHAGDGRTIEAVRLAK
jgi:heat shock protein HslJ